MKLFRKFLSFFRPGSPHSAATQPLANADALPVSAFFTEHPRCCEKLDGCPFFAEYKGNPVIKQRWIDIYCCDPKRSSECERKRVFQLTGVRPPANMTPAGMLLPS